MYSSLYFVIGGRFLIVDDDGQVRKTFVDQLCLWAAPKKVMKGRNGTDQRLVYNADAANPLEEVH
jgi:hypothetical protein